MRQDDDLVYLLRRAAEERRRADEGRTTAARVIHRELAVGYERRAREGSFVRPREITIGIIAEQG